MIKIKLTIKNEEKNVVQASQYSYVEIIRHQWATYRSDYSVLERYA